MFLFKAVWIFLSIFFLILTISVSSLGNEEEKLIESSENPEDNIKSGFDHRDDAEELFITWYALDTNKLYQLAIHEAELYINLKILYKSEEITSNLSDNKMGMKKLKSYLEDYEESVLKAEWSTTLNTTSSLKTPKDSKWRVVTNPISMYRMIRRLAFDIIKLEKDFEINSAEGGVFKALLNFRLVVENLPTEQDVKDALSGLLRLQTVHDFTANKISQGIIGNVATNITLNKKDCLDIGTYALSQHNYVLAIEWMEMAQKIETQADQVLQNEILSQLRSAMILHDKAWKEMEHQSLLNRKDLFVDELWSKKDVERVKVFNILRKQYARSRSLPEVESMDLCAGLDFQEPVVKSKLKCWLDNKKHPYWTINPLKIELQNLEPELVIIRDFIGDNLINLILEAARPHLKRSGTINHGKLSTDFSYTRTSINAWLYDQEESDKDSFLLKINKKIEFVTGLKVNGEKSSHALQVVDYSALGSHYNLHNDCLLSKELIREHGDRIATFMIYLNDVEMGGYTVLPAIGLSTRPIKGSAVLWYNLLREGSPDWRTDHAGCPVVLGRKLIANKWILSHENMFNRKCTLVRNE